MSLFQKDIIGLMKTLLCVEMCLPSIESVETLVVIVANNNAFLTRYLVA